MKAIINFSIFLCFAFSFYSQTYKRAPKTKKVVGVEIDSVQTLSGLNVNDLQWLYDSLIYYKGNLYSGIIKDNYKKRVSQIYNFKNGKIDGKQIIFSENGDFVERLYENGLWTKNTQYFSNGQLQSTMQYKGGLVDGQTTIYDRKGTLVYRANSEMGKRVGEFATYYPNGQLCWLGYYNNNLKSGKWLFYDMSSSKAILRNEENYLNGLKHGKWLSYYPNGKIKGEINYDNNLISGNCISYQENGQILSECIYKSGFAEGKDTTYNQSGKISYVNEYSKGIRVGGESYYYSENGELLRTLKNDENGKIIKCIGDCDGYIIY